MAKIRPATRLRAQSASTSGAGASGDFATTFPVDENPLSSEAAWTMGATTGVLWEDMRSVGGICYDAAPADGPGYNDALAFLKERFHPSKHYVKGVVHYPDSGYTPSSSHELLLHVLGNMTASNCPSYEFNVNRGGVSVQMARYEGGNDGLEDYDFDGFTTISGSLSLPGGGVAHGDSLSVYVELVSGSPRFYLHKNDVEFCVMEDSQVGKHTSGAPGFGIFRRYASGSSDTDPAKYCWSAIEMGSW